MKDQMAPYRARTTAVVITTAMLSFISFWRAGAIVLCDLASTAYYVGGIAEQAFGKAAPWYIAMVMIFANGVRATYIESCGMFVRAGVYRVVKEAMGGTLAKLSVSALIFDFALTGPISSVSAGSYLMGFLNDIFPLLGLNLTIPTAPGAVVFAIAIILYFWHKNVIGIKESSDKALKIMKLTASMVVVLLGWSIISLILDPKPLPPFTPQITPEAWGLLNNVSWLKQIGAIGVMVAIGHSVLAMSGEETLSQVYREIAKPKLKNMKRAAIIIFTFSFMFTAVTTFFAIMIIPDDVRLQFQDNLIAGLVMYLKGPYTLRLIFQGVVVIVGTTILAGAVNTAMIGANGDLCRVAEDGVLASWFRTPHKKYGTTHRLITSIAVVQVIIVLLCRGDIFLLGEAYAFGVMWSFTTQTAAVLILRFKNKAPREWKVPVNLTVFGMEVPIGLALIFVGLLLISILNIFTKTIATKWGMIFTISFFMILVLSEYHNKKLRKMAEDKHEKVNLRYEDEITPEHLGCKNEHRIVVAARDPMSLFHLKVALNQVDHHTTDVIVLTVDRYPHQPKGDLHTLPEDEQHLITNVVALAERHGTTVIPLVVPAKDPAFATAKVAFDLNADEIIIGKSEQVTPEVQIEWYAMAWGFVAAKSGRKINIRVIWPQHELKYELA
ncbi:MAG: amino acid permease [Pseudomonadota bacterium]